MRTFFRDHWKVLIAIVLLVVLALFTVTPSAALPEPTLAERLRAHVSAIAPAQHESATPAGLEAAARYIGNALRTEGYRIGRRQYEAGANKIGDIEASVANVQPGTRPERLFIIGARYDWSADASRMGSPGGSGAAAVLELARLLKDLRPSQGTEVRFVFFAEGQPLPRGLESEYPDAGSPDAGSPDAGNFIAFAGTLAGSRLVQDALGAFHSGSDSTAHGLAAAPGYVQGVTLSDRSPYRRFGYPAVMITTTAFMRYPYYRTNDGGMNDSAKDTPDQIDYESTARVVSGLARTITALAGRART